MTVHNINSGFYKHNIGTTHHQSHPYCLVLFPLFSPLVHYFNESKWINATQLVTLNFVTQRSLLMTAQNYFPPVHIQYNLCTYYSQGNFTSGPILNQAYIHCNNVSYNHTVSQMFGEHHIVTKYNINRH